MSARREDRIHDYLDGRLAPDERRRFEDELARDPDLAARLESARAIGDAIRSGTEDDAPLDEAFYEAARARYASSVGRSQSPPSRPVRRYGWETLGAIAAALLLVAILVPAGLAPSPSSSRIETASDAVGPTRTTAAETPRAPSDEPAPEAPSAATGAPAPGEEGAAETFTRRALAPGADAPARAAQPDSPPAPIATAPLARPGRVEVACREAAWRRYVDRVPSLGRTGLAPREGGCVAFLTAPDDVAVRCATARYVTAPSGAEIHVGRADPGGTPSGADACALSIPPPPGPVTLRVLERSDAGASEDG